MNQNSFERPVFLGFLLLISLVHLLGMFYIPIMDVDASQYASISREMIDNGSFLQVIHRGTDYLDKPPFLFWISALSFKLFGISDFTYRLPSFLFTILGVYSCYRLSLLYYGKKAAQFAALIFYACQAVFLVSHDVRTDTILTGTVIFAVWQILAFIQTQGYANLLWGFTGIAIAMLEKGPIGLMVPVLAIGGQLLYTKDWENLFNPKWLIGLFWVGLLLAPMCWGLYQQFDAQPLKTTNGVVGESGLKFFFWTQSFGRITGENVWQDNTTIFYFLHNFAWAFIPWTLLFIAAIWFKFKNTFTKESTPKAKEVFTLTGLFIPFAVLSLSHYKLPHYIFVLFPFAALICGEYLAQLQERTVRILANIQLVLALLIWVFIAGIVCWVFPQGMAYASVLLSVGLVALIVSYRNKNLDLRLLAPALLAVCFGNFVMNTIFYPRVLNYQAGSSVAKFINTNSIPKNDVVNFNTSSHALEFYTQTIFKDAQLSDINGTKPVWVFTNEQGLELLKNANYTVEEKHIFPSIAVTKLSIRFLNPATRKAACDNNYLLKVKGD